MHWIHGRAYRLTKTVNNSRLDRRCKSGADRTAWNEGRVLYCRIYNGEHEVFAAPSDLKHARSRVEFSDSRRSGVDAIAIGHPDYEAVVSALAIEPDDLESVLSSRLGYDHTSALEVLNLLVTEGRLKLDDIRMAIARLDDGA